MLGYTVADDDAYTFEDTDQVLEHRKQLLANLRLIEDTRRDARRQTSSHVTTTTLLDAASLPNQTRNIALVGRRQYCSATVLASSHPRVRWFDLRRLPHGADAHPRAARFRLWHFRSPISRCLLAQRLALIAGHSEHQVRGPG